MARPNKTKRTQDPPHGRIESFEMALKTCGDPPAEGTREQKKNWAEKLSRNCATWFASGLRPHFPGILPNEDGTAQESLARTTKGFKKLDVNYSTLQLGLALGVSIKSINFPDPKTRRFTKNYSRNDTELRAESSDYHKRQPHAVIVGVLFLPESSCVDGGKGTGDDAGISSFGSAVHFFRTRAGRERPFDDPELFERFFIAVYSQSGSEPRFFDVVNDPPRNRMLRDGEGISFEMFVKEVLSTYQSRNKLAKRTFID